MGWSCAVRAGWVADAWTEACVKQTGSQNVFDADGKRYFWEMSNKEHGDGAITGVIWRYVSDTHVRKSGSFRIEPNGIVSHAPKFLKAVSPKQYVLDARHFKLFGLTPEQRVAANHVAFNKAIAERV